MLISFAFSCDAFDQFASLTASLIRIPSAFFFIQWYKLLPVRIHRLSVTQSNQNAYNQTKGKCRSTIRSTYSLPIRFRIGVKRTPGSRRTTAQIQFRSLRTRRCLDHCRADLFDGPEITEDSQILNIQPLILVGDQKEKVHGSENRLESTLDDRHVPNPDETRRRYCRKQDIDQDQFSRLVQGDTLDKRS